MRRAEIRDVSSPAEGLIHQIDVTIATPVQRGTVVMSLDAGSQPLEISAPCSGTVVEILVKEGDAVQTDQIVARIKKDDGT